MKITSTQKSPWQHRVFQHLKSVLNIELHNSK